MICALTLLVGSLVSAVAAEGKADKQAKKAARAEQKAEKAEKAEAKGKTKAGALRHVVCFKFKDSTTPAQIKEIEEAFQALKTKISEIVSLEWGTNNSPENLNQGCTHCFILTFKNEKDRDAYIVHPDHKAFGGLVGPQLDKVFVVDFFANK